MVKNANWIILFIMYLYVEASEAADIADGKTVVEIVINAVAKTKGENVFAGFILELVAVGGGMVTCVFVATKAGVVGGERDVVEASAQPGAEKQRVVLAIDWIVRHPAIEAEHAL